MHEEWEKSIAQKLKGIARAAPRLFRDPIKRCPKCDLPMLSREQLDTLFGNISAPEERIFLRWCVCHNRYDPREARADRETVYIVGNLEHGYVKVGFSIGASSRLDTLQTASPFPLKTIATLRAPMRVERAIHRYLRESHSHREWFRVTPHVQALIDLAVSGRLQDLVTAWLATAKPNDKLDVHALIDPPRSPLARVTKPR